jgi:hypothetical protein
MVPGLNLGRFCCMNSLGGDPDSDCRVPPTGVPKPKPDGAPPCDDDARGMATGMSGLPCGNSTVYCCMISAARCSMMPRNCEKEQATRR